MKLSWVELSSPFSVSQFYKISIITIIINVLLKLPPVLQFESNPFTYCTIFAQRQFFFTDKKHRIVRILVKLKENDLLLQKL